MGVDGPDAPACDYADSDKEWPLDKRNLYEGRRSDDPTFSDYGESHANKTPSVKDCCRSNESDRSVATSNNADDDSSRHSPSNERCFPIRVNSSINNNDSNNRCYKSVDGPVSPFRMDSHSCYETIYPNIMTSRFSCVESDRPSARSHQYPETKNEDTDSESSMRKRRYFIESSQASYTTPRHLSDERIESPISKHRSRSLLYCELAHKYLINQDSTHHRRRHVIAAPENCRQRKPNSGMEDDVTNNTSYTINFRHRRSNKSSVGNRMRDHIVTVHNTSDRSVSVNRTSNCNRTRDNVNGSFKNCHRMTSPIRGHNGTHAKVIDRSRVRYIHCRQRIGISIRRSGMRFKNPGPLVRQLRVSSEIDNKYGRTLGSVINQMMFNKRNERLLPIRHRRFTSVYSRTRASAMSRARRPVDTLIGIKGKVVDMHSFDSCNLLDERVSNSYNVLGANISNSHRMIGMQVSNSCNNVNKTESDSYNTADMGVTDTYNKVDKRVSDIHSMAYIGVPDSYIRTNMQVSDTYSKVHKHVSDSYNMADRGVSGLYSKVDKQVSNSYNTAKMQVSDSFSKIGKHVSDLCNMIDIGVSNPYNMVDKRVSDSYIKADVRVSNSYNMVNLGVSDTCNIADVPTSEVRSKADERAGKWVRSKRYT